MLSSSENKSYMLRGIREQYESAMCGEPYRHADKQFKPIGWYCPQCYADVDLSECRNSQENKQEATALAATMKKAWGSCSFHAPVILCPCCHAELYLRKPNNLDEPKPVTVTPPEIGTTVSLYRKEFRDGKLITEDIYLGRYAVEKDKANRIILHNHDNNTSIRYSGYFASEYYYSVRTPEQIIASLISPIMVIATTKKYKV